MAQEYMYLVGGESVERAGSAMKQAAQEMNNAAGNIEHSLFQHRQFLDDWLARFEEMLANKQSHTEEKP